MIARARTWLAEGLQDLVLAKATTGDQRQADLLGVLSDDLSMVVSRLDRLGSRYRKRPPARALGAVYGRVQNPIPSLP